MTKKKNHSAFGKKVISRLESVKDYYQDQNTENARVPAITTDNRNLIAALKTVVADTYPLPESLVMVDCEMTGVVPSRDKLLQVAALKLKLKGTQYEMMGEPFLAYLQHDGRPENNFHRQYLTHVFDECNRSTTTPAMVNKRLKEWLGPLCGKVMPVGDCVPTDIAFLLANGCIDSPDIGDAGQIPGTFHYEFFEMNSIKEVARFKQGCKELDIEGYDHDGVHDALVDCRNQTLELNHILKVLLS